MKTVAALLILISCMACIRVHARDLALLPSPQSALAGRNDYKNAILRRALELTQPEYGDFEIRLDGPTMKRRRAMAALRSGKLINVYFSVESPEWDDAAIRIPVPIRRGILNYRLLLIHKDRLQDFSQIKSLSDLEKYTMGVQSDWSTRDYLQQFSLPIVLGQNYNGLFAMLSEQRFDYMLRGVHEIYYELESRERLANQLLVAPNIALFVPLSTYTYVSPKARRLADRIDLGLARMVDNGDLDKLFFKFYGASLARANLCARTMLFLTPEHKALQSSRPSMYYKPCAENSSQ